MTESCVMQTPNKYMDCAILKKEYTVSTSKSLGNRFTIKNINGDSALLTCTNRFKRKKKKIKNVLLSNIHRKGQQNKMSLWFLCYKKCVCWNERVKKIKMSNFKLGYTNIRSGHYKTNSVDGDGFVLMSTFCMKMFWNASWYKSVLLSTHCASPVLYYTFFWFHK